MKKIVASIFIFFSALTSLSAQRFNGNLTLISENKEPFFVFLNGIQYNTNASYAVRIEDVTETFYHVKIVYQNRRIPTLENRQLAISDVNGRMQDITYTLEPNRRGPSAFSVYQIFPMEQIQLNPREVQTYKLGRYNQTVPNRNNWYPDRYNEPRHQPIEPNYPVTSGPRQPVANDAEMQDFLVVINKEAFDNNKTQLVSNFLKHNYLFTNQAMRILESFSHENNKLQVAKMMYDRCLDPENYYKVTTLFSFQSNKVELNKYINNK